MGMQERLIAQGLASGAADASVLKTMVEQSTEQSFVTGTDEKVKAREEAKAAQHNLETFKDAEDRERKQQKDQTKLASDMMQASKQTSGSTIVTGPGVVGPTQVPPNVNIVNAPDHGQTSGGLHCPSCKKDIQASWKACPHCGQSLVPKKCAKCGFELKPDWKACPECGEKL